MVDFFKNGLCIHCYLAKNELQDFAYFNTQVESFWKAEENMLEVRLSKLLEQYPEEHHSEIIESHSWDIHQSQNKYPGVHRESLIITIFNFLEQELNSLCEIFYESIDSELRIKDINGKGVERALTFLKKVVKIDFSSFGYEMPIIKGVNQIRNIIVHNGGILPHDINAKANQFIKSTENLAGNPGHAITIAPEFIGFFINVLLNFFERLESEVQSHIQSYHKNNA